MPHTYEFTNTWFENSAKAIWDGLLPQLRPNRVLEIGSYEGASVCHLIESNNWTENLHIICIDTWDGGVEHKARGINMVSVEDRFDYNIAMAQERNTAQCTVFKVKGRSNSCCAELIHRQNDPFDFIYIDGSHQAPDVLTDAVNCFQLLRIGGVIGFDDYTWNENLSYGVDPLRSPKIAVDAFTTIFSRKIKFINTPNHQMYVQKISD